MSIIKKKNKIDHLPANPHPPRKNKKEQEKENLEFVGSLQKQLVKRESIVLDYKKVLNYKNNKPAIL